jgi:predicted flap endonuclease-1-like 5' DNA nuclease
MPEFNTNQWIVLALVLVLGWFLGLFTLAGGRKWRKAFEVERDARIAADAERDRLAARITEIEQERDRRLELQEARPPINTAIAGPTATPTAVKRDDLSMIFGVGRSGEMKLNALGIHRFTDIVSLSLTDEAALEDRMGLAPGTISEERWRDQAEMLRKGKLEDHARMFA